MTQPTGRIALDIETISPQLGPNDRLDFENPEHFELLIVALGYQAPDGEIEELTALFRSDPTPESELELVSDVIEWIGDRPAEQLLTYNGSRFDLTHLEGRPRIIEGSKGPVTSTWTDVIDGLEHVDLKPPAWRRYGEYTSLEDVCRYEDEPVVETRFDEFEHGFDLDTVLDRRASANSILQSQDMPAIGEPWLAAAVADGDVSFDVQETRRMLEHYALADIKPLFRLAQTLQG